MNAEATIWTESCAGDISLSLTGCIDHSVLLMYQKCFVLYVHIWASYQPSVYHVSKMHNAHSNADDLNISAS